MEMTSSKMLFSDEDRHLIKALQKENISLLVSCQKNFLIKAGVLVD